MQINEQNTDLLERYLGLATAELKVTAGNMANVDTPGFKTLGFDFDRQMHQAIVQGQADDSNVDGGEYSYAAEPRLALTETEGLVSRPDGNNVSMEREGMNMAEAQLKFRTGVALLKSSFAQISEAIHSDAK